MNGKSRSWAQLLHERADPCLLGGGQLLQREGGRPHGAFVEIRCVVEAERRVPALRGQLVTVVWLDATRAKGSCNARR